MDFDVTIRVVFKQGTPNTDNAQDLIACILRNSSDTFKAHDAYGYIESVTEAK